MLIEVCGPGCPRCIATKNNISKALAELEKELKLEGGEQVAVIEIKDPRQMSARGVMFTPAVLIDGIKVTEGRIPEVKEIKKLIQESMPKK